MKSEKTVEVANLLPMNLQVFAEDNNIEDIEEVEPEGEEGQSFDDIIVDDDSSAEDDYIEIEDDIDDTDDNKDDDVDEDIPDFKSDKQNQAFANYRRENESLKKQLEEINDSFANHFSEYGVNDAQSYLEKLQEQQSIQRQRELNEKAEEGDIQAIQELTKLSVLNDPTIKNIISENQLAKQALQEQQTQNAREEIQKQVEELDSLYGTNFKTIEGILDLPEEEGNAILDYMEKGLPAKDAYLLVNKDAVLKGEHTKAKQDAIKKASGRNHMKKSSGSPDKPENIRMSREQYQAYKEFFPDMTDKEIKQAYKEALKDEGVI